LLVEIIVASAILLLFIALAAHFYPLYTASIHQHRWARILFFTCFLVAFVVAFQAGT
jgi:hypothetical protein